MRSQAEIEQAIEFELGVIHRAEEADDALLESVSRARLDVLEWVDRGEDRILLGMVLMGLSGAVSASLGWAVAWAVLR